MLTQVLHQLGVSDEDMAAWGSEALDRRRYFARLAVLARASEAERGQRGARHRHMLAVDAFAAHYQTRLDALLDLAEKFAQAAVDAQRSLDEGSDPRAFAAEGERLWAAMELLAKGSGR